MVKHLGLLTYSPPPHPQVQRKLTDPLCYRVSQQSTLRESTFLGEGSASYKLESSSVFSKISVSPKMENKVEKEIKNHGKEVERDLLRMVERAFPGVVTFGYFLAVVDSHGGL